MNVIVWFKQGIYSLRNVWHDLILVVCCSSADSSILVRLATPRCIISHTHAAYPKPMATTLSVQSAFALFQSRQPPVRPTRLGITLKSRSLVFRFALQHIQSVVELHVNLPSSSRCFLPIPCEILARVWEDFALVNSFLLLELES